MTFYAVAQIVALTTLRTVLGESTLMSDVAHYFRCAATAPGFIRRHLLIQIGEDALDAVDNGRTPDDEELAALIRSARYARKLLRATQRDIAALRVERRGYELPATYEKRLADSKQKLRDLGSACADRLHLWAQEPTCRCSLHETA